MEAIDNHRVISRRGVVTPEQVKAAFPRSAEARNFISRSRQTVRRILEDVDHRLFVVVGPCSIHDPKAALEYAHRLKVLAEKVSDTLYLIMRVYFEKPRTTVGWKGFINDPYLDGSCQIDDGLNAARRLLVAIAELGVPAATEALDPVSPQYWEDLITWTAIGARTTESQTHREMASGLPSAVGFKNGTDGSLVVAMNAIKASARAHKFLGTDGDGNIAIVQTTGNSESHVVLRGGGGRPNYDSANVARCEQTLIENSLKPRIMIDCSHANSNNNYEQQQDVMEDVVNQILEGNRSIKALMLESNLCPGNQRLPENSGGLQYGVSITDPCIGWETTENCLKSMRDKLKHVLKTRTHSDVLAHHHTVCTSA